VAFEWDPHKAAVNLRKHRVDFADAVSVFKDPLALTVPDDDPEEARVVTVGMNALGDILTVAYTWRGDSIRLISARKATRSELRRYEGKR
jgi:uncharacterized DUF497 family protein